MILEHITRRQQHSRHTADNATHYKVSSHTYINIIIKFPVRPAAHKTRRAHSSLQNYSFFRNKRNFSNTFLINVFTENQSLKNIFIKTSFLIVKNTLIIDLYQDNLLM